MRPTGTSAQAIGAKRRGAYHPHMLAKHRLGLLVAITFTGATAVMWAAFNHPVTAVIFGVGALLETFVAFRFWNKPNA